MDSPIREHRWIIARLAAVRLKSEYDIEMPTTTVYDLYTTDEDLDNKIDARWVLDRVLDDVN